jgi:hypothetical protein
LTGEIFKPPGTKIELNHLICSPFRFRAWESLPRVVAALPGSPTSFPGSFVDQHLQTAHVQGMLGKLGTLAAEPPQVTLSEELD